MNSRGFCKWDCLQQVSLRSPRLSALRGSIAGAADSTATCSRHVQKLGTYAPQPLVQRKRTRKNARVTVSPINGPRTRSSGGHCNVSAANCWKTCPSRSSTCCTVSACYCNMSTDRSTLSTHCRTMSTHCRTALTHCRTASTHCRTLSTHCEHVVGGR